MLRSAKKDDGSQKKNVLFSRSIHYTRSQIAECGLLCGIPSRTFPLAGQIKKTNPEKLPGKGAKAPTQKNIKAATKAELANAPAAKKPAKTPTRKPGNDRPDKISEASPLTPRKITQRVYERLVGELQFDPLIAAVSIAKGEKQGQVHPHLMKLRRTISQMKAEIKEGKPVTADALDLMFERAMAAMSDEPAPIELQSRHQLELLKYIYPQLKSMDPEATGGIADILEDMRLTKPITEKSAKIVRLIFEQNF